MGTRSLTIINDEQGKELCCIYQQFDGYPAGVGKQLHDLLRDMKIINGISGEANAGTHANGMGCLAAQVVAAIKDHIGGVYLYPPGTRDCGEEYIYTISVGKKCKGPTEFTGAHTVNLQVKAGADTIYDGPCKNFDPNMEEKETT